MFVDKARIAKIIKALTASGWVYTSEMDGLSKRDRVLLKRLLGMSTDELREHVRAMKRQAKESRPGDPLPGLADSVLSEMILYQREAKPVVQDGAHRRGALKS